MDGPCLFWSGIRPVFEPCYRTATAQARDDAAGCLKNNHDFDGRAARRKGKQFFFEKKNQKTFASLTYAAGTVRDSRPKVFWFFFSKKN
jgi:hypothetical protein